MINAKNILGILLVLSTTTFFVGFNNISDDVVARQKLTTSSSNIIVKTELYSEDALANTSEEEEESLEGYVFQEPEYFPPMDSEADRKYEWNKLNRRTELKAMFKMDPQLKEVRTDKKQVQIFVAIMSGYSEMDAMRRKAVRETWLKNLLELAPAGSVDYSFIMGQPTKQHHEECIQSPYAKMYSKRYPWVTRSELLLDDIVFGPFIDSYRNLSIKTMYAAKYVDANYDVEWMIKVDNDVYVNEKKLWTLFLTIRTKVGPEMYSGLLASPMKPWRSHSRTEWVVSWDEMPDLKGPRWVHGWFYAMGSKFVKILSSQEYPHVHIEDLNTAIVANKNGLKPSHWGGIANSDDTDKCWLSVHTLKTIDRYYHHANRQICP